MRNNPYKDLPPLERRPDGTHYRMTPAQRKQANALIRRECCNCEDGDCIALDDGDTCTCPQMISFSVCCKWFRWSVLPQIGMLEAEIFRDKELKRCAVCGRVFVPKSNRAKYCPDCGQLGAEKSLIYKASRVRNRGKSYQVSPSPGNTVLTVHKTRYDKYDLYSSAGEIGQLHTLTQLPL